MATRSQRNYWSKHELSSACFGLGADMEHNLTEIQQHHMEKEFNSEISLPQSPFVPETYCLMSDNTLHRPLEGDQVVPSCQRRTVFGGLQRGPKPLPPPPDPEEVMADEAADNEVEFFTSDRRRLLPKSSPKGVSRGNGREWGQVNQAYQDRLAEAGRSDTMAFSWPSREDKGRGRGFEAWGSALYGQQVASTVRDSACSKQPDAQWSSKFRFSFSGCSFQPHGHAGDKPQVPPRIPLPQKPHPLEKMFAACEDDKPPKIPPRVPLLPPCPPRTPSPKSLPIYINGVMPATQSFAANPKYVSKALQRQHSQRSPPTGQFSPCIVPIMKDGRQASATHYILLPPGRPPRTDRRERLAGNAGRMGSASLWQGR